MKSKFIKSTIILVVGGFITKILGMLSKIILTRLVGLDGMGLYMLIMPTFNLFIAIAQLGFPVAISKLVSEEKRSSKNILGSILPISILLNLVLFFILLFLAPILSEHLLHNSDAYYPILSIGLVLPFISLSSILRGYFYGKQRIFPDVLSHIVEQVSRLTILMTITPYLLTKGVYIAVSGIVLVNIISETLCSFVFFLFLPKKFQISKTDFIPQKDTVKEVLSISIPTTGSRIIGSVTYFLEPIILTGVLLKIGYDNEFILREYALISGYVMPLLLMPSFFTQAISSALLPVLTKGYAKGQKAYTKGKLNQGILFSCIIGFIVTIVFLFKPDFFLQLIYGTKEGAQYVRILAPVFFLYYLEAPFSAAMQAFNLSKKAMYGTLLSAILKTILLYTLLHLKIGLYPLIITISFNILFVVIYQYYSIKKALA